MAEPQYQAAFAQALQMPPLERQTPADVASKSASLLPRTLGEYQILAELGHGGMGRVYKARHTKLDRVVAVKLLARARLGDPQAMSRFEREMRAVGLLDHPNIVQAYDAREIDETPVLIMEFVDGLDLADLLRRTGPLPVADACELVRRTALALQYAHEHGLVHRDIKPSNIMLSKSGEVKLLDLGLARFYTEGSTGILPVPNGEQGAAGILPVLPVEEMTGSGQVMGTADYMAPEQAADSRTADIRADIYSLGCTLYKLLCGHAPFSGPDYRGTLDKLSAHARREIPPLRQFVPDLPDVLAAILDRMLAKDPADRFATPTEVAAAVAPFCRNVGQVSNLSKEARQVGNLSYEADLPELITRAISLPIDSWAKSEKSHDAPRPATAPNRRRPIVTYLLIGMAFFGAIVLSFAAGVLIRINKDGKETNVEVPPGSTAKIGADGQVDVTLPGQQKAGGKAVQSQESPLQFAPEIEKVINSKSEGKGSEALDLAGNKLVDLPQDFNNWSVERQEQWFKENNIDLLVDFENIAPAQGMADTGVLLPKGLKLTAIATQQWDSISDEELRLALRQLTAETIFDPNVHKSELVIATVREKGGITAYLLPSMVYGYPPWTFAFQTRQGDLGILQVIRFTEEPKGMRIRYKLAKPPSQPSASNPAADLKALQGHWKTARQQNGESVDAMWLGYFNAAKISRLLFRDQYVDVVNFEIGEEGNLSFQIEPTTTPKRIDIREQGETGHLAAVGIYDFEGDQLKICLAKYQSSLKNDQRPKSFSVDPKSGDTLLTLERYRPSQDEKALQGGWTIASQTENGKAIAEEQFRDFKWGFGDCHVMVSKKDIMQTIVYHGPLLLEENKDPKRMTIYTYENVYNPPPTKIQLHGIYKIDGGRLTIAYRKNGPVPDKFESTPDSGVTLLELKRSEPKPAAEAVPSPDDSKAKTDRDGKPIEESGEKAKKDDTRVGK
jgi:uncharacterized protein (TIGR03067 family)